MGIIKSDDRKSNDGAHIRDFFFMKNVLYVCGGFEAFRHKYGNESNKNLQQQTAKWKQIWDSATSVVRGSMRWNWKIVDAILFECGLFVAFR